MELVAKILKSIHTHESKKVTRENTIALMEKLYVMKLTDNAKKAEDIINELLLIVNSLADTLVSIPTMSLRD